MKIGNRCRGCWTKEGCDCPVSFSGKSLPVLFELGEMEGRCGGERMSPQSVHSHITFLLFLQPGQWELLPLSHFQPLKLRGS